MNASQVKTVIIETVPRALWFALKATPFAREGLYIAGCTSIFQCGAAGASPARQAQAKVILLRLLT